MENATEKIVKRYYFTRFKKYYKITATYNPSKATRKHKALCFKSQLSLTIFSKTNNYQQTLILISSKHAFI